MKIVLTGISATPYAREYISNAAQTLRQRGHQVFVPHEGGWSAPEKPAAANLFDFESTFQALQEADLMMAILDGYSVDDAVATQVGIFYTLARLGEKKRQMIGILHDTRVAGWSWNGEDKALAPQVRQCIHTYGKVYPNLSKAMSALEQKAE